MQPYKLIEIFTDEEARWRGEPLYNAIVQFVHDQKIAARCLVTRGVAGAYESGEIATASLEVLSYNMPLRITIVLPAVESERILATLTEMVASGVVAVQDVQVISHKTRGLPFPKQTRVRDIMTPDPRQVHLDTPVDDVARLLLSATFTAVPVVDQDKYPRGVISQGDLIYKAGMPLRPGLLAASTNEKVGEVLAALASRKAEEIMTQPAVTIEQDKLVTAAVNLMLQQQVPRLLVVDAHGRLVGNLSRVDVFHTMVRECPDWQAFQKQKITVANLRSVSDIMLRDAPTVLPDAPVAEVIRLLGCGDFQRVGVVDQEGYFLGWIADEDLLAAFADHHPGFWDYLVSKIPLPERGRRDKQLPRDLELKTAGEVMNTNIATVPEDAPVPEALRLMLDKAMKRLPVLDAQGKFKGMVNRDTLLRAGFLEEKEKPPPGS